MQELLVSYGRKKGIIIEGIKRKRFIGLNPQSIIRNAATQTSSPIYHMALINDRIFACGDKEGLSIIEVHPYGFETINTFSDGNNVGSIAKLSPSEIIFCSYYGSSTNFIYIYDWKLDAVINTLTRHKEVGQDCIIPLDHKHVLVAEEYRLVIWNVREPNGKEIRVIETVDSEKIRGVDVRHDGTVVTVAEYTIGIYDMNKGECIVSNRQTYDLYCMTLVDYDRIACGTRAGEVVIFDLKSCEKIGYIASIGSFIAQITFLANETIITVSQNNISLWNITEQTLLCEIEPNMTYIYSIIVVDDSQFISGSFDNKIVKWQMPDNTIVRTFDAPHKLYTSFKRGSFCDVVLCTDLSPVFLEQRED